VAARELRGGPGPRRGVVLRAFLGLEHGAAAAGDDAADLARARAEGGRALRGLEDAEAAARAGADEEQRPAAGQRPGGGLRGARDGRSLAAHGGRDEGVLGVDEVD